MHLLLQLCLCLLVQQSTQCELKDCSVDPWGDNSMFDEYFFLSPEHVDFYSLKACGSVSHPTTETVTLCESPKTEPTPSPSDTSTAKRKRSSCSKSAMPKRKKNSPARPKHKAPLTRILYLSEEESSALTRKADIFTQIRALFVEKTGLDESAFDGYCWMGFPDSVPLHPSGWTEKDLTAIEASLPHLTFAPLSPNQRALHRKHTSGVRFSPVHSDSDRTDPSDTSLLTQSTSSIPVCVPVFPVLLVNERQRIIRRLRSMLQQQHGDSGHRSLSLYHWVNWPTAVTTQSESWTFADLAEIWHALPTVKFERLALSEPRTLAHHANTKRDTVRNLLLQRFRDETNNPSALSIRCILADLSNIPAKYDIIKLDCKMIDRQTYYENSEIIDNIHFVSPFTKKYEERVLKRNLLTKYKIELQDPNAKRVPWETVRLAGCPDGVDFKRLNINEIRILARTIDSLTFYSK